MESASRGKCWEGCTQRRCRSQAQCAALPLVGWPCRKAIAQALHSEALQEEIVQDEEIADLLRVTSRELGHIVGSSGGAVVNDGGGGGAGGLALRRTGSLPTRSLPISPRSEDVELESAWESIEMPGGRGGASGAAAANGVGVPAAGSSKPRRGKAPRGAGGSGDGGKRPGGAGGGGGLEDSDWEDMLPVQPWGPKAPIVQELVPLNR